MNSTNDFRHVLARGIWGIAALGSATTAGAVTMRTVAAFDTSACTAFKKIIAKADIAHMTDKQLCDFRFSRLDASMTDGLLFPQWTELAVADPTEVVRKASAGNARPNLPIEAGYPTPELIKSASLAANARNLGLHTTSVQIEGKGPQMTILSADLVSCPTADFQDAIGLPTLWIFADKELHAQESLTPSSLATDGAQLALWKATIPVSLSLSDRWTKVPGSSEPWVLLATMRGLTRTKDESSPEYVRSYLVCEFRIERKE